MTLKFKNLGLYTILRCQAVAVTNRSSPLKYYFLFRSEQIQSSSSIGIQYNTEIKVIGVNVLFVEAVVPIRIHKRRIPIRSCRIRYRTKVRTGSKSCVFRNNFLAYLLIKKKKWQEECMTSYLNRWIQPKYKAAWIWIWGPKKLWLRPGQALQPSREPCIQAKGSH